MIQITDRIWLGDSNDEMHSNLEDNGITAILNVAQDLNPTRGWNYGIEYCHVGLIDGPGNQVSMYCSAVLALDALAHKYKVLVCCHTGSRATAVCIMYLKLMTGLQNWGTLLEIIRERANIDIPEPNDVHKEAFFKMRWGMLETITLKG